MSPTFPSPAPQAAVTALSLVLVLFGAFIYTRVIGRLRAEGGAVRASSFDLPELLMSSVLATFFGGLVVRTALTHSESAGDISPGEVLPSSLIFAGFVAGLGIFMSCRGLRISELFGLTRLSFARAAAWAALLLVAAVPFVLIVNALSVLWLKGAAVEQPLVKLFRDAAQRGDFATMGKIAAAGVILAPVCEEFLFRGFFYGVGKRYFGPWISGLFTAALFAAFHASLTSFAGLLLLAIAFTLAYERTGSLVVPITMHAFFNATSLGLLYLQSILRAPA